MKNYLVEQQLKTDTQGLFNRFWLIRAVDSNDAIKIMSNRLDSRYYIVTSAKEYNPLTDTMRIVNFSYYTSLYEI